MWPPFVGAPTTTLPVPRARIRISRGFELLPCAGSFYQHGPLLQTASYGADYTDSLVRLILQAAGTVFSLSAGLPTEAFATLVLDGQQYSLRTAADGTLRTSWDLLPRGRGVRHAAALFDFVCTCTLQTCIVRDRTHAS